MFLMDTSNHEILDVGLKGGALLHRFKSGGCDECSAIYFNGLEAMFCFRERETEMIKRWNTQGYKKWARVNGGAKK